jgi:hypothetical protein
MGRQSGVRGHFIEISTQLGYDFKQSEPLPAMVGHSRYGPYAAYKGVPNWYRHWGEEPALSQHGFLALDNLRMIT